MKSVLLLIILINIVISQDNIIDSTNGVKEEDLIFQSGLSTNQEENKPEAYDKCQKITNASKENCKALSNKEVNCCYYSGKMPSEQDFAEMGAELAKMFGLGKRNLQGDVMMCVPLENPPQEGDEGYEFAKALGLIDIAKKVNGLIEDLYEKNGSLSCSTSYINLGASLLLFLAYLF